MEENCINALKAAEEYGLYLKVVTSVQAFDNYNSFFNIFEQFDEPCRRIAVLTPYKGLEEVNDEKPGEPVIPNTIVEGNIWLKEYPLTINPEDIDLEEIFTLRELVEKIQKEKI
ncbi:MAG: hypothetical protein ABRQ25_03320 [Clostridiaceae bacterium]